MIQRYTALMIWLDSIIVKGFRIHLPSSNLIDCVKTYKIYIIYFTYWFSHSVPHPN